MKAGTPLTDEDRWPWLRAIAAAIDAIGRAARRGCRVLGAAARLSRHSDRRPRADVRLVYLQGSHALIAERMRARQGHFMPTALLDSQFAHVGRTWARTKIRSPSVDRRHARRDRRHHRNQGACHERSFAIIRACADRVVFITGGASGIGAEQSRISPHRVRGRVRRHQRRARRRRWWRRRRDAGHPEPFYQHCDLTDIGALRARSTPRPKNSGRSPCW
jgi:gluconate kinase